MRNFPFPGPPMRIVNGCGGEAKVTLQLSTDYLNFMDGVRYDKSLPTPLPPLKEYSKFLWIKYETKSSKSDARDYKWFMNGWLFATERVYDNSELSSVFNYGEYDIIGGEI